MNFAVRKTIEFSALSCGIMKGLGGGFTGRGACFSLGCTMRTCSSVNVGHAGAKSAVNTSEISMKCGDCQKGDGRRFGTLLTSASTCCIMLI